MTELFLDTETFNVRDIDVGSYRYAETAELLLFPYAVDDGPVTLWDVTVDPLIPAELDEALRDPRVVKIAHNRMFDAPVIRHTLGIDIPPEQWDDVMVQAYSHAYPGKLEVLGDILGLPVDKAKITDGERLIAKFCKPAPVNHRAYRYTRHTHPEDWQRFCDYAVRDVEAMREVRKRLPTWNWREHDKRLWCFDQRANERGMRLDRELCEAGAIAAAHEKDALAEEFVRLTGGEVTSPQRRAKFLGYLNAEFGLNLDNTRKDTFHPLVDSGTMDPRCERLMRISLMANKTSTAKYAKAVPAIMDDGRFRGGLQFRGAARTRRWAGRIIQGQNLPSRGLPDQVDINQYVEALKAGCHDILFDDQMRFASAALRAMVIAPDPEQPTPDGRYARGTFAIADLSNIEGRLGAWFADETWKLDAFRAFDAGTGPDLYMLTACGIVGGDPYDTKRLVEGMTEKVRNVFGKVPDLFGLYAGGFGAAQTFGQAYGLRTLDGRVMSNFWDAIEANIDPEIVSAARANWTAWGAERNPDADYDEWIACETVKLAWRRRHPATVRLWDRIKVAVVNAIKYPGKAYRAGRWLTYQMARHHGTSYLLCALPRPGAFLVYAEPKLHLDNAGAAQRDRYRRGDYRDIPDHGRGVSVTYMGIDEQATGGAFGKWQRLHTHPGKFLEQACQSTAMDVMVDRAEDIEAAGLLPVLSVHDELICERHSDAGVPELCAFMSTTPDWAPGLPLAAGGFETRVYRKD